MAFLSEAELERALLEQFRGLGYAIEQEADIGPDGRRPERASYDEVVLERRLADAVARLNPALPADARHEAMRRVTQSGLPNLLSATASARAPKPTSCKRGRFPNGWRRPSRATMPTPSPLPRFCRS